MDKRSQVHRKYFLTGHKKYAMGKCNQPLKVQRSIKSHNEYKDRGPNASIFLFFFFLDGELKMVSFLKNYKWTSLWFKNPTIEKTRNPQSQYNNKTKQKVLVIADPLQLPPWTPKKTTWATNTIDQNWEPDCLNTQQYPSPFFLEPRTHN